jgi:transposase
LGTNKNKYDTKRMARVSRLLSKEVVSYAESGLIKLGKSGIVAIKLKSIICANNYGITFAAKAFGTTKATLIAWIKHVKEECLELLTVQKGRGRKNTLTEAQEKIIYDWIKEDSQITIDKLRLKIMSDLKVEIGRSTVHRLMKKLKFSYITPRPQHYKQDQNSLMEVKKNLIERIKKIKDRKLFFMDEARVATYSKLGHG